MARRFVGVTAVVCLLALAAGDGEALSTRGRHRRQSSSPWVWGSDASLQGDKELLTSRSRKEEDATGILTYFSDVLSSICCNTGYGFDTTTKTCKKYKKYKVESEVLTHRSGVTTLPHNCPAGTKYDSESKRCREKFRK